MPQTYSAEFSLWGDQLSPRGLCTWLPYPRIRRPWFGNMVDGLGSLWPPSHPLTGISLKGKTQNNCLGLTKVFTGRETTRNSIRFFLRILKIIGLLFFGCLNMWFSFFIYLVFSCVCMFNMLILDKSFHTTYFEVAGKVYTFTNQIWMFLLLFLFSYPWYC